jgi:hypothetical protein
MSAEFKIGRLRFTWAGQWATSTVYARDNVVQYNGKIYVCLTPHTSNSVSFYTNSSYWNLVADGKTWLGNWNSGTAYSLGNLVSYGGQIYTCITPNNDNAFTSSKWTTWTLFDKWNATGWEINYNYGVGHVVKYGGIVYRCNTNHTSAATTALGLEANQSSWSIVDSGVEYTGVYSAKRYRLNDLAKVGPNIYQCTTYHTATGTFNSTNWTLWMPGYESASTWTTLTVYQSGDVVSYGGYDYVSNTVNNTGNTPSINATDWTLLARGYRVRGAWPNSPTLVGDVLTRNGRLYVATADTNQDPSAITTVTTYASSGSSGTTLVVGSTTASISTGMIVVGAGFTQGQTVVSIIDGTSLLLNKAPDGAVTNGQTLTFTGVTAASYQLLSPGSFWLNRWSTTTNYVVGDTVVWQQFTYTCVQNNTAIRPDQDASRIYWQYYIAHAQKNALNTTGDIAYYSSTSNSSVALPIGSSSYALKVATNIPSWAKLNAIPASYYVAPNGIDRADYGTNWDQPWKTIKYACNYIKSGTLTPYAVASLTANKNWAIAEMIQWTVYQITNNLSPFSTTYVLDQTKATRDAGYIVDALIYDISRGGNSQTVAAALAYFAYGSTNTFFNTAVAADVPYYLPMLARLSSLLNYVIDQVIIPQSYQSLNGIATPILQITNLTASESGAYTQVTSLLSIITVALTNQSTGAVPPSNSGITATVNVKTGNYSESLPITVPENVAISGDELRGVVIQPLVAVNTVATGSTATKITVVSTAGFTANMPIQFGTAFASLTAATTYYVQAGTITSTQFSVTAVSNGLSPQGLVVSSNQKVTVYGGDAIKNMFLFRNGSGLRNVTLSGLLGFLGAADSYGIQRPTGGAYASLDPGSGPNDTTAWIFRRSPYCQNVSMFGTGCVGVKIDGTLHNGGNRSIVANDFTTILSDGIGAWCTGSNSLTELVSVFSYYGYMGYFAENGGRMRATNGNTSYGTYGCVALGFDTTEVPAAGTVFNRSQQVQATVQSSLGSSSQLIKINFANAGNNYFKQTTNLLNYSNAFTSNWLTDGNIVLQKNTSAPTGLIEAWTLTGTSASTGSSYIYQDIAIPKAGGVFIGVSGSTNAGGGGATFDVTVTSTAYTVVVNQGGSNYGVTNTITISGTVFGGIAGTNDLLLTVFALSGSSITNVTVSGIVPSSAALSYTCSTYVYAGTSSTIDLYAIFSGSSTVTSSLTYNFVTGALTPSSSGGGFFPINYGRQTTTISGWYRLWMAVNDTTGQNTLLQFRIYPRGATGTINTNTVIYGAQVELSSSSYSPNFYLETENARYTAYANYQVIGSGTGAVLLGDELRTNSVFETRVTDTGTGLGGAGYLTASNSAQSGNTTSIQIAQSDILLSSNYVTMRIFINSGTGAGQYGTIGSYDSSTKLVQVLRESFDNVPVTVATATPTNTFTVSDKISTLYINQAIQFIPTYYTISITGSNLGQQTVTAAVGGSTNTLTVANAYAFYTNMPVNFSGTIFTSVINGFTYYVKDIINGTTITLSSTPSGTLLSINAGTGSFNINYPTNTYYLTGAAGITSNMTVHLPITFTGNALGGLSVGTGYYIQDVIDSSTFTVASSLITITPTSCSTSAFTTALTSNLIPLNPIVFTGSVFGGITTNTKYYIGSVTNTGTTAFTIVASPILVIVNRTSSGSDFITINEAVVNSFVIGNPIVFSGTSFGGILIEHTYYILAQIDSTNFTICDNAPNSTIVNLSSVFPARGVLYARTAGTPVTLSATGSGSMTATTTPRKLAIAQGSGTMSGTYSTTLFGGITPGQTYYVDTITPGLASAGTISVSLTQGVGYVGSGSPVTLTTGSGAMNIAAVGWDHINPGSPIQAVLDSTSLYFIEPRLTYTDPAFTQTVATTVYGLSSGVFWTAMAYGNGYFVAVPNAGATAARATSGDVWASISLPISATWSNIAYGAGYFVMIASASNSVLYSASNGAGWKSTTMPVTANWNSIAYGNGRFVALANNSTYSTYSTDFGQTWTQSVIKGRKTASVFSGAKISTTQSKFGGSSLALNGTTDYISIPSSTDFALGTGDFTVELWVYRTTSPGTGQILFDFRSSSINMVAPLVALNSNYTVRLYVNGADVITGADVVALSTWTHIAVSRTSGSTKLWVNGAQQGSTYTDTNSYVQGPVTIGAQADASTQFAGYIDGFRISKGIGRYTTTYAVPIVAPSIDSNAVLLLNFDGLNNSTVITNTEMWSSIAYGAGIFVAVATTSATASYSTDGITWTASTLPSSASWASIAYGNGRFIAVASSSSHGVYSFNGITWYSSLVPITATSVTYGQGVFLALNSGSATAYTSDSGYDWNVRSVQTSTYTAIAFGITALNTGIFSTLGNQNLGFTVSAGARTKGRANISSNAITSIIEWEPGSGYTTSPTLAITDPNVTALATYTLRTGTGTLGQPTFVSRGTNYNNASTIVTITGSGYSDSFQSGFTIILNNLTRLPLVGDNLTITGISQVYKVTSASAMFGSTAPNFEANVQISPAMIPSLSPANGVAVQVRTKYSQVRLTGHDFLYIGSGNFGTTNYPSGVSIATSAPQNQTVELNFGRVFFTSTDQDGNFKVGELFGVQQATGIVTLSASQFGLSGLSTLSLGGVALGGSGVVIQGFSTDGTFTANTDSVIPTQKAVKTYLTSRLTQGGSNTSTGQLTAGTILVGGAQFIASTIPEDTIGSNVQMTSKVYISGSDGASTVDGDMAALDFFMRNATRRSQ